MNHYDFATAAVHAGWSPDPVTGAVSPPVYQVSTFEQDAPGRHRGYDYSRAGNPTRTALESALAELEGGGRGQPAHGITFASGLAATDAVLRLLKPGDRVVAGEDLYGGTRRLFERVYGPWGLAVDYVDASDPAAFARAVRPETRLAWVESPTNPLLTTIDIRALAAALDGSGVTIAVDNTFATPYFQRPLELGAHLVVHSTTKYLAGHSDVIGGAVVTADPDMAAALRFHQMAVGAVPGPWDAWLTLRGMRTLALRMRAHDENGRAVAAYLGSHPAVARVHYPGFGGMVSFELAGGPVAAEPFFARLALFTLAESLGGVESLANLPAKMTHASVSAAERAARGISDALVRLSCGIEAAADLVADLERALG